MLHLFRRTLPSVYLTRSVLDLIGKRGKSRSHFAVECLGSQAAQFDDLVLNHGQPLDVASHLLANSQIFRRRFAAVVLLFVAHLSALIEAAEAGSFHGRDMDEHVLAAVVGLNKSVTLRRVKPLDRTCRDVRTPPFFKTMATI
jgi:hypothetical protein